MTQADSVHSTPPTNTSVDIPLADSGKPVEGLYHPTPVTPEEAFQAIGRLRKEARDEIDRLIRFLDETDNHMEREPDGDEADASYPESGVKPSSPLEDDEDSDTDEDDDPAEPSLGSHTSSEHSNQEAWGYQPAAMCRVAGTDLEDEHDGAEEEDEGDDRPEDEPSLGWTVDGCMTQKQYRSRWGEIICDVEAECD